MPDNALYHQWPLAGAVFTATVACMSALWFLYQIKADQTRAAVLEIRSELSRLFQETVAYETLRIFEYVDASLPSALAQSEASRANTSAFDRLCIELRKLDPAKPDRPAYKVILGQVLAGLISKEAKQAIAASETKVGFEFQTESKLAFLAQKTAKVIQHEKGYSLTRKWCFRGISVAPLFAVNLLVMLLVPSKWGYAGALFALFMWACTLAVCVVSFVLHIKCHNWLLDTARKDCLKNEWLEKSANAKG